MLSTIGTAGDFLTGTNYEFQCTAKNIFGETSVIKSIQITSSELNNVKIFITITMYLSWSHKCRLYVTIYYNSVVKYVNFS